MSHARMRGRYLNLEEVKGGLKVTLTPEGYEELEGQDWENQDTDILFTDLFEDYWTNGWTMLQPEQIGALTSCGLITSPDVEMDDDGEVVSADTVYWHERYQVEDPIAELLSKKGYLFLQKGT